MVCGVPSTGTRCTWDRPLGRPPIWDLAASVKWNIKDTPWATKGKDERFDKLLGLTFETVVAPLVVQASLGIAMKATTFTDVCSWYSISCIE